MGLAKPNAFDALKLCFRGQKGDVLMMPQPERDRTNEGVGNEIPRPGWPGRKGLDDGIDQVDECSSSLGIGTGWYRGGAISHTRALSVFRSEAQNRVFCIWQYLQLQKNSRMTTPSLYHSTCIYHAPA